MAFKNSIKATLLSETEQPRSRSDDSRALIEEAAPTAPPATQRASDNTMRQPSENVAERPSENAATNAAQRVSTSPAKPSPVAQAATVPPLIKSDTSLAAAWHARAERLCAMAGTLPCTSSWSLISKIANLYDELARDAGWTEPGACAPDNVHLEEPEAGEEPPGKDEPPTVVSQADPSASASVAFSRRPLPVGRRFPRRRG